MVNYLRLSMTKMHTSWVLKPLGHSVILLKNYLVIYNTDDCIIYFPTQSTHYAGIRMMDLRKEMKEQHSIHFIYSYMNWTI